MWIVRLALRRPYTFVVMALVIILLTPVVLMRTPTDIFPEINIPVISLVWTYTGLQPQEMEQRITSNVERGLTTLVNDVEHIESQSLNGIAVIKVFFQPHANIQTALAQTAAISQTFLRFLPPGTTPPLVIIYSASTVPVIQIGLTSDTLSEQQLFDQGNNFIRTQLATVPGAATPFPYGGKQRVISVDINSASLQAKGLTAVDIVNAVNAQNLILPTGTAKLGPLEYNVEMNGSPQTIQELNELPVKTVNGATIYMKDVAHVRDGFSPQTNIVLANGQRGVLMSIYKTGGASTIDIVYRVKQMLAYNKSSLPEGMKVSTFFDQSLYVRASIQGVLREALIAACLTAIMIMLFLGNWKSTLIIAVSIPLSILVSILCLSALGETINIMTLGGLALAVGILVDDATVEIENINRNLAMGKETVQAILDGAQQIAVPAFVSTLCICIVFIPMFFLSGVAKFLFVPLAEAVSFAMLASYMWSRTIVPTLAMYLLSSEDEYRADEHVGERMGFFRRYQQGFERRFEQFRQGYRSALHTTLHFPRLFSAGFLGFCAFSVLSGFVLGRDFFPKVDAGQIRLHMRARTGLRIEETARLTDQVNAVIRETIPKEEITTLLDNIGLPYSGINLTYSNAGTIGTSDAEILVQLKEERGKSTSAYINDLRQRLPRIFPGVQFFFQPADIVTQILNFGTPAPIDVEITGMNQRGNYLVGEKLASQFRHIPGAVDVHVHQEFDDPTLFLQIDRARAQSVGMESRDVAQNLLVSLSSSFQTAPAFWLDPKNGVEYQVAVQEPQYRVDSYQALQNTPINNTSRGATPQILGNLVQTSTVTRPAEISHYTTQPMINVYAAVDGRDLGSVADEVDRRVKAIESDLPRGSHIVIRGQVQTMKNSFTGLGFGLLGAIVLAYLLIVVNFQSWLDPFIIITALPGALAGICWMLLLTHTTLNVPSLTGAIMCMGVATANSILMISFAREQMDEGKGAREAALEAGFVRIRPVLMTALAMIIGMVPMALGLGEGGEQNAPLGRAVIGGLVFATFATLFFVPCVFSMIHGRRARRGEGAAAPSTA
ncbi:MAG: efflux RND transporter permease subunit [Acidobacteria bacterium Pan2503]|uniref:Efflux RND transporter permease subunit n=1 Tax=Candidatus Acidiferrum panamense TaxID=2741543 RepID=A0A7V8NM57_9BACT|nr:efflux RND transporter permease subunit [Candidatus Acidoferrum panamensis]